jgi:hypothetical protein
MKKIIIMLLAVSTASCAVTHVEKIRPNPYVHLTAKNVQKNCQSDASKSKIIENWQVGVMGVRGLVLLFEDCLNVRNLLVIVIDAEAPSEEIIKHSVKLLELHYIVYKNVQNSETDQLEWSMKKLNQETSNGWSNHFYELTSKKIGCTEGACPHPNLQQKNE